MVYDRPAREIDQNYTIKEDLYYRTAFIRRIVSITYLGRASHSHISRLTCSAVVPLVPHLADTERIVAGPCADAALAAPVGTLAYGRREQVEQQNAAKCYHQRRGTQAHPSCYVQRHR